MKLFVIVCVQLIAATTNWQSVSSEVTSAWRWTCEYGDCIKKPLEPTDMPTALGLQACKMFCHSGGTLWPKPSGKAELGNHLARVDFKKISFNLINHGKSDSLLTAAIERFKNIVSKTIPKDVIVKPGGKQVVVRLINKYPDLNELTLNLNESYSLESAGTEAGVDVNIRAENFFGLRHGLETLSQLFLHDEIRNELQLVRNAAITDDPAYAYRGFLLDTARNYVYIDSIKKTIDAMAMVKLNSFHWHITDTHSFPFVSERRPELSKLGAYTPTKVYTKSAIRDLVQYATVRGVKVIPEFDAPAHVGEGWQSSNLTLCFNKEPWLNYCVEPPCGQFDPTKDELYNALEDIYTDMADVFSADVFHMGGDEVKYTCWEQTPHVVDFMSQNRWGDGSTGFLKLWDYFQNNARQRLLKAYGKKMPVIMWTSSLTESSDVERYLPIDEYIIQVWTTGTDLQIEYLLSRGYKLIMSNYDALYLDCGFGAWIGSGNNWCSPYIGWQKVYDNNPAANVSASYKKQIIGGEAALWSEQADSSSLDNKAWPRLAALAERLWTDPATTSADALPRMLFMRERLVNVGIQADTIQPEWCLRNGGYCQ